LAQRLDGKRGEEASDYTFIAPIQRFRVGNPGFLGGFGYGSVRLRLGHGKKKRARLTEEVHSSATPERGSARGCGSWAGPRRRGEERASSSASMAHQREGRMGRPARFGSGGPPGHRATGKG
jgi:hypothetical protein